MQAFFKKAQRKRFIMISSDHALTEFFENNTDIIAVGFRIITSEMVVSRGAGAGTPGIGFFGHQCFGACTG